MIVIFGMVVVILIFLAVGFLVVKEMRTHMFWRREIARGNVEMIGAIVEGELARWRSSRPPMGMEAGLWSGIQASELAGVDADTLHMTGAAEGEYRMVEGRRVEVVPVLDEAMKLAAKLVEMMFYDLPNLRMPRARVDVYTSFREEDGSATQRCILTTTAARELAMDIPWETLTPREVLSRFETHYRLSATGAPLAIDPDSEYVAREPLLSQRDELVDQQRPFRRPHPSADHG
jgi:hypothetical protein